MLLGKVLDGITSIIEFFARVVLFLFKVLGLWIPAIYSIVFVIVCGILEKPFEEVLDLYLIGLAISVVFAFYVMFLKMLRNKKRRYMKKQERKVQSKMHKNSTDENNSEETQATEDQMIIKPPEKAYEVNPQAEAMEQLKAEKYQAYQSPITPTQENVDRTMQSYPPLQFNAEPPQYVPKQEEVTASKPKIFRTRMDPNLLIYEYSDRLVFYRKTLNGLEHVKTERKYPNKNF